MTEWFQGRLYYPGDHSGFLVLHADQLRGVITYEPVKEDYEITLLHTDLPRKGIGRKLVDFVIQKAKEAGVHRFWLITTNDKIQAIGFYQKIGFDLVKLHYNALENSRLANKLEDRPRKSSCHGNDNPGSTVVRSRFYKKLHRHSFPQGLFQDLL